MKYLVLTFLLLLSSISVMALEVDEKLTLRILKTSESRKTMLINRGIEDGLAKGNHAKFFLSVGVVARAVVIKISPTRSVWSVYRLVNAEYIKDDLVLNLKITSPVKISKDPTRMMVVDDTAVSMGVEDPRDLGIPLAAGAEDDANPITVTTEAHPSNFVKDIRSRKMEVFLGGYLSNSSSTVLSTSDEYSAPSVLSNFVVGGEYYFGRKNQLLSRVSLYGTFSAQQRSVSAYQGATVSETSNEMSLGGTWSLLPYHDKTYKFNPYVSAAYSVGSIATTYTRGNEGSSVSEATNSGTYAATGFGIGVKYYLSNGIGARLHGDYKNQVDSYGADANGDEWQVRRSGFVTTLALSYRF